jgi:hypothetical protein
MIYNRRNFTQETGKTVLTNGATSGADLNEAVMQKVRKNEVKYPAT